MLNEDLSNAISELETALYDPPKGLLYDAKDTLIDKKLTSLLSVCGNYTGFIKINHSEYAEIIREIDENMQELQYHLIKRQLSHEKKNATLREIIRLSSQVRGILRSIEEKKSISRLDDAMKLAKKTRDELFESEKSLVSILMACKTICRYCGISDKHEWINDELTGYRNKYQTNGEMFENLPTYRIGKLNFISANGHPCQLPYNQLSIFSKHPIDESISELEGFQEYYGIAGGVILDELNKYIQQTLVEKSTFVFVRVVKAEMPNTYVKKALEGVKLRVNEFLDELILELEYGKIPESIFEQVREEVDFKFAKYCPNAIEKLAVAYEQLASEPNQVIASQVASTCRRIIVDVADAVYPSSNPIMLNGKEIPLEQKHYRNRILQGISKNLTSDSEKNIFASMFDYVDNFLKAINDYASKGDHSDFNKTDAKRCVVYTYLLLGDILHYYSKE